ncbi:fatty acid desaturase [Pleurocapsales cyanobacterium LEGE 06147]|nr:fatty acid desaturase [Pleurocapsales cyanobacterium LEGE 06147]
MVSLIFFLSFNVVEYPNWLILPAIFWQAFLYTGLFITAHDAMHGAVFPKNQKINRFIGTLALLLYGLFSYQKLLEKHWLHHHYPASDRDPDFHNGKNKHPLFWYFHFMMGYWSWKRMLGLTVVFYAMKYGLYISDTNLLYFWMISPLLSSFQLTHQEPKEGYKNHHRAKTTALPIFWSLITCYHFGYHEEHHEYPNVPWWKLPTIYKMRTPS